MPAVCLLSSRRDLHVFKRASIPNWARLLKEKTIILSSLNNADVIWWETKLSVLYPPPPHPLLCCSHIYFLMGKINEIYIQMETIIAIHQHQSARIKTGPECVSAGGCLWCSTVLRASWPWPIESSRNRQTGSIYCGSLGLFHHAATGSRNPTTSTAFGRRLHVRDFLLEFV